MSCTPKPTVAERPGDGFSTPLATPLATTIPHVAANPTYKPHRRRNIWTNDLEMKTRSYRNTMSGAVMITALLPIPSAQEMIAAAYHQIPRGECAPRTTQYTVNR